MMAATHRGRLALIAVAGAMLAALGPAPFAAAQGAAADFTSATRYDAMRRVTGTIAPDPDGAGAIKYAATRNTYDAAGRLTKVEKGELAAWQAETIAPSAWVGFTIFQTIDTVYDVMDRKLRETLSAGGTAYSLTEFSYDLAGRLVCTAVRMNPTAYASLPASACTPGTPGANGADRITRNSYDGFGQLVREQRAYGTPLQQDYATYAYSANGKRTAVIDANGNKATMSYDGLDRQIRWSFPDKVVTGAVSATDYEAYGYDANGNRTSLRKRDGQVIGYSYDALNRMTVKDIPGGTTADVYYGYDLRGLQTHARFGSASGSGITSSYTGFGELATSSTDQGGTARTLSYAYDANGNRVLVQHPDGKLITYLYDGLDRMELVYANGTDQLASFYYDIQGRRQTMGRGVTGAGIAYSYDPVSRLTGYSNVFPNAASTLHLAFAYNPASQLTVKIRSNDAYRFTGYAGTSQTYVANGLNQYSNVGGAALGYDLNGNLTSDSASTYVYDVENRLIAASGAKSATLSYDPLGRLYRVAGPTGDTRFLYDGDELVAEYDAAGNMLKRYVHGAGEDDPIVAFDGVLTTVATQRHLFTDQQGSIVATTDSAGVVLGINAYDEYGVPNAGNSGRFQYTGQAWLSELGLYHYKARLYAPALGRFLQTDPIGYDDQINLYAYVGSDPINSVDPTGMDGACIYAGGCTPKGPTIGSVLWDTIKKDPGVLIDAAIVVGDILLGGPTGEAAIGIALRRGATVRAEAASRVSTLRPGPNARESIPAQAGRPTSAQQRGINRIGDRNGCHTCGSRDSGRRSGNWTGDHQPPSGRNSADQPQRFYPHCANCSARQGGEVSNANRRQTQPPPPPPSPRRRHED